MPCPATFPVRRNSPGRFSEAHRRQQQCLRHKILKVRHWDTVSSGPTEESVQAALAQLKQTYPTGSTYPTPYRSTSGGPYGCGVTCSGWATLCSDAAFGDLPWRRVDKPSWDQIRPGDLIRYDNSSNGHVVVVVKKTDEYIKVTESGLNNKARWGGQYFKWWLEEQPGYTLYTRYPD